jgi:hypothetical protein
MKIINIKKLISLLAMIVFFGVFNLYSQPGEPGGDPAEGDPPVGAPIDGGAVVLLVAGVAYGAKKLKANNQAKINNDSTELD